MSTIQADGYVRESPESLAAADGVPVDTETLARVMDSEESDGTAREKTAIGWAVVNETARYSVVRGRPVSILERVTYVTGIGPTWRYGRQTQGRYVSTARDAGPQALQLAEGILSGRIADPTRGYQRFLDPVSMVAGHAGDPTLYDALDAKVAEWNGEGWQGPWAFSDRVWLFHKPTEGQEDYVALLVGGGTGGVATASVGGAFAAMLALAPVAVGATYLVRYLRRGRSSR